MAFFPNFSLPRRIAYCLGDPGWQISSALVVSVGIYYYLPPEQSGLSPQLSQELILGVFTAYGLARLLGGVVDSLADPLVGHYSDASRSRFGRRRSFLILSVAPMIACSALIFWPPGEPGSPLTFWFLAASLSAYFVFFTMYVGPYLAITPEVARSEEERVSLTRLRAALGGPILMGFGFAWLKGVSAARELGLEPEEAVRWVVIVASAVAFLLCLLPIFAVDESRFERSRPTQLSWRQALGTTLRDRPFLIYLCAQIFAILGLTMIMPSVPYLAGTLLGRDAGFAANLGLALVPSIVLGFVFLDRLVTRLGSRRTMIASMLVMGCALAPLGLLRPAAPGDAAYTTNLIAICACFAVGGLPFASILVLPMVILGQLIDLDELKTHSNRSAMYHGVQGLMTKWVYSASAAIMSSLFALFGATQQEPLGVVLIGPVVAGLCFCSAFVYRFYPERRVLRETQRLAAHAPQREGDAPARPSTLS